MVISHPEKDIISSERYRRHHKGQGAAAANRVITESPSGSRAPAQRAPRGEGWLRARPGRPR